MGRSRVQRGAVKKMSHRPKPEPIVGAVSSVNPPIPDVTRLGLAFGKIDHMPRYDAVPDNFKRMNDPYASFISSWFFSGISQPELARLRPREGVNQSKALAAIGTIMRSFEPKHEHKEAGCAFLLHAWFELVALGAHPVCDK